MNSHVEMLRECQAVTYHHPVTTAQVQSQDLDREGAYGGLCEVSDVCGCVGERGCMVAGTPAASLGNLRHVNTCALLVSQQSRSKSADQGASQQSKEQVSGARSKSAVQGASQQC